MLEVGEFDKLINTQTDALISNPVAMRQAQQEQKASMGKGVLPPLLKALALQKVASETAAAENQLKLSMQQNPATIVEQLEQNATARTQDDLLKQTAGIMGERNKRRQQQMSPAKPPQQVAQGAPQGLAGAPRPPMQMAQGGIIGYKKGEEVEGEGSRLERALKALGMTYKEYMGLSPTAKKDIDPKIQQEYVKQRKAFTDDLASQGLTIPNTPIGDFARENNPSSEGYEERRAADSEKRRRRLNPTDAEKLEDTREDNKAKGTSTGINSISDAQSSALQGAMGIGGGGPQAGAISGIAAEAKRKQDAIAQQGQQAAVPLKPGAGVLKPGGIPSVPDMKGAGVLAPPAGQPPAGGLEVAAATDPLNKALGTANVSEDQLTSTSLRGEDFPVNTSKTQATDALGSETMGIMKNMRDLKPKESLIAQEKLGDVRFKRDAKRKAEEDLIAKKKALDDKQLDPESVARERANAGLAGLIQGGTSRGASVARSKFDANVSQRQRDAINETIKLTRDKDKSDDERLKAIDVTAGKVFERESADRIAALQGLVGVSGEDVRQINNQAKLEFEANKFGIQSKLTALATQAKQDLNRLIQENANVTQYSALLKQVQAGQVAALDAMYETMAAEMKLAETNVLAGTAKPEEIKMVRDKQIRYLAILDMAGMHDLIEELRAAAVKGTGRNTPTTADPLKDAMNKYD